MDVDRALAHVAIVIPYMDQQLSAVIDTVLMRHEKCEQAVFPGCQRNRLTSDGEAVAGVVGQYVAGTHLTTRLRTGGPPQACANACHQFIQIERFGHKIIGTRFEGPHGIGFCRLPGHHHHAQCSQLLAALYELQELNAIEIG